MSSFATWLFTLYWQWTQCLCRNRLRYTMLYNGRTHQHKQYPPSDPGSERSPVPLLEPSVTLGQVLDFMLSPPSYDPGLSYRVKIVFHINPTESMALLLRCILDWGLNDFFFFFISSISYINLWELHISAILTPHLWHLPFLNIQWTKVTVWMSTMKPCPIQAVNNLHPSALFPEYPLLLSQWSTCHWGNHK